MSLEGCARRMREPSKMPVRTPRRVRKRSGSRRQALHCGQQLRRGFSSPPPTHPAPCTAPSVLDRCQCQQLLSCREDDQPLKALLARTCSAPLQVNHMHAQADRGFSSPPPTHPPCTAASAPDRCKCHGPHSLCIDFAPDFKLQIRTGCRLS